MGGRGVVRGVTELMGVVTAAMAGKSTVTKKSVGFCHVPTREPQEPQSSTNFPLNDDSEIGLFNQPTSGHTHYFRMDDWEYPIQEDWDGSSNNYDKNEFNELVFVPPPSQEEVEEAAKDLHVALRISRPESSLLVEGSHTLGLIQNRDKKGELIPSQVPVAIEEEEVVDTSLSSSVPMAIKEEKMVDTSLSSSLPICLSVLTGGGNYVYQAFNLLQTNPKVQDAVKSLAQDPAVWKAVLSNKKVIELTQSLHGGDDETVQKKSLPSKQYHDEINILDITSKVCDFVSGRVIRIINKVTEIAGSMFSSVEKTLCSKETSSSMDKTVASCMMLAVAVLLVVLVKRVAVK